MAENNDSSHSISDARLSAVRIQLGSQQPNNVRMAFKQVNQWLQDNPENREVYKMLVEVAANNLDLRENVQDLFETMKQKGSKAATEAAELLPATIQDLIIKADEFYYTGDSEKAIQLYRHVLKQDPENQRAKGQLAKLNLARLPERPDKAIPPEAVRWYRQARSYIAAQDYQTAITFLNAAIDAARESNVDFRHAKDLLRATQKLLCPDEEETNDIPSIESVQVESQDAPDKTPKLTRMVYKLHSILFLSADPTDAARIKVGEEMHEIQDQLQRAKLRNRFKMSIRLSARPLDISQSLLDDKPNIVHFSGHGSETGALCFQNKVGQIQPVEPGALAALFEQFTENVNCVLLNACYSEIQARAIAEYIEWVIGMNNEIGDEAAISFSIGFYQALGAGKTIEEAYKLGCVQIRLQGIPEHLTPVLIKKQ